MTDYLPSPTALEERSMFSGTPSAKRSAWPTTGDASAARARYGVLGFTLLLAAIAYLDRVCIFILSPLITFNFTTGGSRCPLPFPG